MFERRRRTTRFQVEKLEGRAAPGIIATGAFLQRAGEILLVKGHTTSPTRHGETLEIWATETLPGLPIPNVISKDQITVVEGPRLPGETGHFSIRLASKDPYDHWSLDGTIHVYMENISIRSKEVGISVLHAQPD
jgi:hypothetical protein